MPQVDYRLVTFGGLALERADGSPVALRSRKARALLAILSTERGLRASRARLAALLWGDRGEAQARGSLRQALAELRRALGPGSGDLVPTEGEEVALDGERIEVDHLRFESLVAGQDAAGLERAVALAGGPFLDGFDLREDAFDEWRRAEAVRLEAQLVEGLARLAALRESEGSLESALAHLDRALALAPLREELHCQAMRLCAQLGRSAEALDRYRRLEARLGEELGVGPQPATRALRDELRELRDASAPDEVGPAGRPARSAADARDRSEGRPSVAVLPFVNLSEDPEQDFFADGMTEDIIAELTRFRGLFVIARNSTFVYKGRAVDTREIARELGVRYVVEGSVRRSGERVRISAQLIEAERRSHVWAERYHREIVDLFELQDEIVRTLVAAIEPELDEAERRHAAAASPERLDAWGAVHRGMWHVYRFTPEDTARALALFERATELAPAEPSGWTGRSFAHFSNAFLGFVDDREAERRSCLEAARRAVELDPRDADAHWALGRAYSLELDYERAIPELERAVELNTNAAQAWYQLGWLRVRAGRHRDAIEPLLLAERLSPNDPLRFAFLIARAQAHYLLGEYDRALALSETASRLPHAHAQVEAVRIACLVKNGRERAARDAMAAFREAHPEFSRAFFREAHGFAREEDLARYLEALEAAGLPE